MTLIMFICVCLAIFLLSSRISHVYKKNIEETLGLTFAGTILVMYVLAFFRGLGVMSVAAGACMVYVALRTYFDARKRNISFIKEAKDVLKPLLNENVLMLILITAFVGFFTRETVFTWWDDINFWSSDARQLFFLKGFPSKYGNVSPEFGDYPPVTSLVKWLFLQISPYQYKESLQFLGYFALNAVFLLPLTGKIREYIYGRDLNRGVKALLTVVAFVSVMLLPGVFNGIIYYGTPADISMAIIYGALLLFIYDEAGCGRTYYYIRMAVFTSVLLLTKSIGFEWALFALLFYALVAKKDKMVLLPVLAGGASLGSWLLFCFLNRRVAKLTGAGIKMATSGNYRAPDNTPEKMRYFFEGFLFQPMHADHNLTLDLSTGAAVLIIFAFIALLYYGNILGKTETRKVAVFTLLTGVLAYGIVFLAHISIFQTEDQYLDAYAMAVSIARYCAPFALGSIYLLSGILFNRLKAKSGQKKYQLALLVFLLMIFLTADYSGVYRQLWGYRENVASDQAYVADMVGENGKKLADTASDKEYWGKRVLVLRDGHSYYWVHNAYISKAASPTALVYDTFLMEEDTTESIRQKIKDSHASYIYVEDDEGISKKLFSDLLGDPRFEAGRIYKIDGIVY